MVMLIIGTAYTQGMKISEVIILSSPSLNKDVKPETFQTFTTEKLLPDLNRKEPGTTHHLFKADRGDKKGQFLLAAGIEKIKDRATAKSGNPFDPGSVSSDSKSLRDFVSNPQAFTEYHLIGADQIRSLPNSGILGIHAIKVKKERSKDFEKFVIEKLHPAVSHLFPDLQLLYYKSVAGENSGSYITLFTIDSPSARDKYWPAGAPETDVLKKTFKPLEPLAKELGTYLEEDSYLKPESGGAAAYWESKEWTDFIHSRYLK
jgi:hypothetical protein